MERTIFEMEHDMFRDSVRKFIQHEVSPHVDRWHEQGIVDRELFAKAKEAKMRGYKPGRFSFNVKGGRCEACQGDGVIKIEMHFLPDMYVRCETCRGARYNRETLDIRYKGKNIHEVLDMTVEEAIKFVMSLGVVVPRWNKEQTRELPLKMPTD